MLELEEQLQQAIIRKEIVGRSSSDGTCWGKPPASLVNLGYIDLNDYKQILDSNSSPKGRWHYLVLKPFAIRFCQSRTGATALSLMLSIANSAGAIVNSNGASNDDISPVIQVQQNQRVAFLNITSSAGTYYYHENYWAYQILPYEFD